jgi:hypothetical protein
VKTELEDLKKSERPSLSPVDKASLDDLKDRLAGIEQHLNKMQIQTRTALSPSPAASGRITLTNLYNDKLLFVINGRDFTILPGQSQTVEGVPPGPFMYRVFSPQHGWVGEPQTRTLAANQTYTLSAALP